MLRRVALITSCLTIGSFVFVIALASAQVGIEFPVAELGNCDSKEACRTYCEAVDHREACMEFARKHKLVSTEESERYEQHKKIAESGGPGGCKGEQECRAYCEDTKNIKVCIAFAKANGLMPAPELEEAERVAKALDEGAVLPGGCKNKSECNAYCSQAEHMEECIAFAERAGFMRAEEVQNVKKTMQLMREGRSPGNCQSKEECDAFCSKEENLEVCLNFGKESGMFDEKEAERRRADIMRQREAQLGDPTRGMWTGDERMRPPSPAKMSEELRSCLETELGSEGFSAIFGQSPVPMRPTAEIEEKMRRCFMEFGSAANEISQPNSGQGFIIQSQIPPEVLECVKAKAGDSEAQRLKRGGEAELNDSTAKALRECFTEFADKQGRGSEGKPGSLPPPMLREGPSLQRSERPTQLPSVPRIKEPVQTQPGFQNIEMKESMEKRCLEFGGEWNGEHCIKTAPLPTSAEKAPFMSADPTLTRPIEQQPDVSIPQTENLPVAFPSGVTPDALCAEAGGTWSSTGCDFENPPVFEPIPADGSAFSVFRALLGL